MGLSHYWDIFGHHIEHGVVDADCLNDIFPCAGSLIGNVLLMCIYGFILGKGSKLIADGAELLLNVANPSLVGGFVLPVLGAVPDAAIIVASCLGDPSEIQQQISVGVGTLAGSTIMLLTVSYGASMLCGRCDIVHGRAVDKTNTRPWWDVIRSGTSVDPDVPINAWIMIGVSLLYAIIQIPAFFYMNSRDPGPHERWFAAAGAVMCFIVLLGYSTYCVCNSTMQNRKAAKAKQRFLKRRTAHAFLELLQKPEGTSNEEEKPLLADPEAQEEEKPVVDMAKFARRIKLKASEAVDRNKYGIDKKQEPEEEEEETGVEGWPKWRILGMSFLLMFIGTAVVTIFSDPMVDAMSNFSTIVGISPFYVAFVVSPLASNASELISALIFSSKKMRTNMSLTISALYGAATMNATLCLGIFYVLIAIREVSWRFSGQVVAILLCVVVIGILGSFKTQRTFLAFFIIGMYPICLAVVPIAKFIGLR
ncbi:Sodium/calcium exchanger protein [Carpediemonas membranifera]|uniref:Sodium/calcium exchanger protein n=1 Tax=Carpediemonas membranifera TaxID=201153 RepID=A0A8J6C106_9EUKA|nr:Sodium/calcium exchanger protein [Carpediemonas membranifera]|eukprot:KAG9397101.1 Sodium/calcium exchanger protein [Carpediemonas membranifera]